MLDIFSYKELPSFLADCLSEKRARNANFSLRSWAKQIGYRSPSLLSDVMNGKRPISLTLAAQLSDNLSLTPSEKQYFQLLVLKSGSKKADERKLYDSILERWTSEMGHQEIDLDSYHLIADWYHSAILEMFSLNDFDADPLAIAKRLGGALTTASIEAALDRLQRLGLLTVADDGKLVRNGEHLHVGREVSHEAVRRHHVQMIEKAQTAVTEQPTNERHIFGTTLSIRRKDYDEAKLVIERFHREMRKFTCDQGADDVYRINTQFFNLTPGKNSNVNVNVNANRKH